MEVPKRPDQVPNRKYRVPMSLCTAALGLESFPTAVGVVRTHLLHVNLAVNGLVPHHGKINVFLTLGKRETTITSAYNSLMLMIAAEPTLCGSKTASCMEFIKAGSSNLRNYEYNNLLCTYKTRGKSSAGQADWCNLTSLISRTSI